jgi:hypothetical protein
MRRIFIGVFLLLGGCGGGNGVVPPPPKPATVPVNFENVVQGLPVGVDVFYPPDITEAEGVLVCGQSPPRLVYNQSWRKEGLVTTADYGSVVAVPALDLDTPTGIQWWVWEGRWGRCEELPKPEKIVIFPVPAR